MLLPAQDHQEPPGPGRAQPGSLRLRRRCDLLKAHGSWVVWPCTQPVSRQVHPTSRPVAPPDQEAQAPRLKEAQPLPRREPGPSPAKPPPSVQSAAGGTSKPTGLSSGTPRDTLVHAQSVLSPSHLLSLPPPPPQPQAELDGGLPSKGHEGGPGHPCSCSHTAGCHPARRQLLQ